MSSKLTADQVADYLISLAHERGESVNNMKLQRLLYYAQAWHLGQYDEPLFDEKFEAWSTGPVIPSIYWRFKPFGISDLPAQPNLPVPAPETRSYLDDLAADYLPLDEWELEDLSRSEPPWRNARGWLDISEPCNRELLEEDMRLHFHHHRDAA